MYALFSQLLTNHVIFCHLWHVTFKIKNYVDDKALEDIPVQH